MSCPIVSLSIVPKPFNSLGDKEFASSTWGERSSGESATRSMDTIEYGGRGNLNCKRSAGRLSILLSIMGHGATRKESSYNLGSTSYIGADSTTSTAVSSDSR